MQEGLQREGSGEEAESSRSEAASGAPCISHNVTGRASDAASNRSDASPAALKAGPSSSHHNLVLGEHSRSAMHCTLTCSVPGHGCLLPMQVDVRGCKISSCPAAEV